MSYKTGDKFVIEIEDIGNGLYRAVPFKTLVFDKYGLDQMGQLVQGVDTFSYNKGLEDAWELAKAISCTPYHGGFSTGELEGIFGRSTVDEAFASHTAKQAMDKYKAWKEKVDWSKVAVDTPILVKNYPNEEWLNRHFARYENGYILAYDDGNTSWSGNGRVCAWKFAELAERSEE